MTTLTAMELQALLVCIDPRKSADEMINDPGMVMAGLHEMMEECGWSRHQAAAIIGSLEHKRMGSSDYNDGNGHIFWPTDEGYRAAYAALAA